MKTSNYCIPIETDEKVLLFDSFSKTFLIVGKNRFEEIYEKGVFKLDILTDRERNILLKNGLLLPDDIDQKELTIASIYAKRLRKTSYNLIINPTMDCNLSCWYCYENHEENSRIDEALLFSIYEHIKLKFFEDKFETLNLSFFGGEPLLATSQVCEMILWAREFCFENKISLKVHLTTNGTLIRDEFLEVMQDLECFFQITIDGSRLRHDKIRVFKGNGEGSFDIITQNLQKIQELIPRSFITLRINYDAQTFKSDSDLEMIVNLLDRDRMKVSLHRVWQVKSARISDEDIFDFVLKIKNLGVQVEVQGYNLNSTMCYADRLNSCVINYNGDVYKCTARDFSKANRSGRLDSSGVILWDYPKLREYCMRDIPKMCQECILLPSCLGVCSQGVIDSKGIPQCSLKRDEKLDELVLMHYFLADKSVNKLSL